MADKSPLRRWKPFFPAFGAIDAGIEAAGPEGCSRDMYRQVRGDIVEMLCDAAGDDDGRAEELCRLLDVAMAEALETLRVVPVTPAMLTTTDVAKAVHGLQRHESARVSGLARAVMSAWRASLEAALGMVPQTSRDDDEVVTAAAGAPPVTGCIRSGGRVPETTLVQAGGVKQQAARILDMEWPKTKKVPLSVSIAGHGDDRVRNVETTNRKHYYS